MVMISKQDRLLSRLASCLRLDKNDYTHLHVEVDAIIAYLMEFGIQVPPAQYEKLVGEMMNKHVLNLELGQPNMMKIIAQTLVDLAVNLIRHAELSSVQNIITEPEDVSKILKG